MNESEKHVAAILLAKIADADGMSVSATITRYRDFIEAVNQRKRVLVAGWSELKELSGWEEPEQEAPEDEGEVDRVEYWNAVANGAATQMCNGPFHSKKSAEEYKRVYQCDGQNTIKVVVYK